MAEIKCDNCGIVKKRKPSDINDTYNFCSRECGHIFKKELNKDKTKVNKFVKSKWSTMNIRCGKYKHLQTEVQKKKNRCYENISIEFTRDEFKEFCFKNKNLILTLDRPSIDRIDEKGNYSLDNIRIIELKDNIRLSKVGNRWENYNKKRGVRFNKGNYSARIYYKSKYINLGTFDDEESAYNAFYNKYLELRGAPPWEKKDD